MIHGGLEFQAPIELGFWLCRRLRTVTRVLLRLGKFPAGSEAELIARFKQVNWPDFLASGSRVSVKFSSKSSRLSMSRQIEQVLAKTLKPIKVGIDKNSNTALYVRIFRDECELSIDCIGEASFKRDAHQKGSIASLRTSTAAALLRVLFQGVHEPFVLVDPMCGAGTWLTEALDFDSAIDQRDMVYENFPIYQSNRSLFSQKQDSQFQLVHVCGFDNNNKAIAIARKNLKAYQNTTIESRDIFKRDDSLLERAPFIDSRSHPQKRIVVVNPPWGKRLPGAGHDFLQAIYEQYQPTRLGVLIPMHWRLSEIPLSCVRQIVFKNSGVDNRFLVFA